MLEKPPGIEHHLAVDILGLPPELYKLVVLPKRWIVERSFGWLEDYRLLWKN